MSKYRFDAIKKVGKLDDLRVLVISGSHNIFIDMVIADVKSREDVENKLASRLAQNTGSLISEEFDTSDENDSGLDLDTFFKVCTSMSPIGKWLCKVNYDILSKKERDKIKAYIKKPSEHAILIVTVSEFANIRELRTIRAFESSKVSHYLDIQYPKRTILYEILNELFRSRGYCITEQCMQLFIMKLGSAYDEYISSIDIIDERLVHLKNSVQTEKLLIAPADGGVADEETHKLANIGIKEFKEAMQGIDYFVIEDFLHELLKPIHNSKIVKRRKVYKILDTLLYDFSAKDICKRLRYRVEELLYYRAYINKGFIPVRTRYNADKIKERLPEDSKLRKATSITFKRNAYVASLTSVEDWYYIYSMLCRCGDWATEEQHMAVLYAIMGRTAISNDRLMNAVKIKNTLEEGLFELNGIFYSPWWRENMTDVKKGAVKDEDIIENEQAIEN